LGDYTKGNERKGPEIEEVERLAESFERLFPKYLKESD
jgi:hypothetical protein